MPAAGQQLVPLSPTNIAPAGGYLEDQFAPVGMRKFCFKPLQGNVARCNGGLGSGLGFIRPIDQSC